MESWNIRETRPRHSQTKFSTLSCNFKAYRFSWICCSVSGCHLQRSKLLKLEQYIIIHIIFWLDLFIYIYIYAYAKYVQVVNVAIAWMLPVVSTAEIHDSTMRIQSNRMHRAIHKSRWSDSSHRKDGMFLVLLLRLSIPMVTYSHLHLHLYLYLQLYLYPFVGVWIELWTLHCGVVQIVAFFAPN